MLAVAPTFPGFFTFNQGIPGLCLWRIISWKRPISETRKPFSSSIASFSRKIHRIFTLSLLTSRALHVMLHGRGGSYVGFRSLIFGFVVEANSSYLRERSTAAKER